MDDFIRTDLALYLNKFCALCMYGPNSAVDRESFFADLLLFLETAKSAIFDFNSACYGNARSNVSLSVHRSVRPLENWVDECRLGDAGYFKLCSSRLTFTHSQVRSHARLDRI